MPLDRGTRLGRYEVVALLGSGGKRDVYRARDTRLRRDVAIKRLQATLAADPRARDRFERESRAVAQLTNPHICTLHDVGTERDQLYLVMDDRPY